MLKLISCFSMGIGGNGRPTLELLGNVAHAGAEKYSCKKYIIIYDQVVFIDFFSLKVKKRVPYTIPAVLIPVGTNHYSDVQCMLY